MPTSDPHPLEPFEGIDVIGSSIKITRAGDGLSQALAVTPVAYELGAKVFVVLECDVDKVTYGEVKDTDALRREHTFAAAMATIVDADLVKDLIDRQREIIVKSREEAAGIQRLPMGEGEPAPHPARVLLDELKKDKLREIAEANGVKVPKSATSDRIIEALIDQVVGIEDVARYALEADKPDSEANVTPIGNVIEGIE